MPQTTFPTTPLAEIPQDLHCVLTVIEVAHELRCSKAHVLNLIHGKVHGASPLPALWLGRRRLVRRCSLDEWLKANEHGAML